MIMGLGWMMGGVGTGGVGVDGVEEADEGDTGLVMEQEEEAVAVAEVEARMN